MRLTDVLSDPKIFARKGYATPLFDVAKVREKTYKQPTWVHFGAGNIFRAFLAAMLQKALEDGHDTGVIVAESFDYEIIERAYTPFDNLSLLVTLGGDGSVKKSVIASVTESLRAGFEFEDWARLVEIFRNPSLQMVSFTITEKGYQVAADDLTRGLNPVSAMGKIAVLLHERMKAGNLPITLQSMDNCSRNGDLLKDAVLQYAKNWTKAGITSDDFLDYLEKNVKYPLSMIDKITPFPDSEVKRQLEADGFEDTELIVTAKGSHTAAFVNAEETEYLVMSSDYANGHPPLERYGAIFTDRETVDKVEKMKVCTCLNPLHTALAIFGCLLGYTRICEEMKDPDLVALITKMGYDEALPVVINPGVIKPADFINAVITKRLPNPFMPDAPQRIATDTSQKLAIRFGVTLKSYDLKGLSVENLRFIPLTLAAYGRYLCGVNDSGTKFTPSPDPKLAELSRIVANLDIHSTDNDFSVLKELYSNVDVFGVDLYKLGLGERIEEMTRNLYNGVGAVRRVLQEMLKD
ncbi:MAG: mannitol dehydrogenase family protein [Turicibacter sp.]|nr:mannitol dehydrogenase family protein [Turicibacter sp.]